MQVQRVTQAEMTAAQEHCLAGGAAAVYSARSPEKQSPNEDSAALIPVDGQSAVLVVADGMGGTAAGELASGLAVDHVIAAVEAAGPEESSLRAAILDGIEAANRAILDLGVGAGSTLVAVEIRDHFARPYHVGDSMVLLVGQRGKIKLQTISHSPVGYAVEAGLLDESEALHHEDRHLVSNALGAPDMRIEVGSSVPLAPRDTLLLASDGLFDNLRLEEIIERVRKGPLKRAAKRLAADAWQRMSVPEPGQPSKADDLTLIAFRRGRPAHATT